MILRHKLKDPNTMMLTGMAFLLAGSVGNAVAQRIADDFWAAFAWGITGTAWGVAFGLLLLAARRKKSF